MSSLRGITDVIYAGNDIDKKMRANEIYYKAADWIREAYPDRYDQLVCSAEDILYDYSLDWAKDIVRSMRPFGEYWTFETVSEYLKSKGIVDHHCDYYLAMNMAYNDYRQIAEANGIDPASFCFDIASRFINDEDGPKHKVAKYFSL